MSEENNKTGIEIIEEFSAVYQEDILPVKLSKDYRIFSCLKYTTTKRVYILEEKNSQARYILKCQIGEDAALLQKEYEILTSIEEDIAPKAFSCFTIQGVTYLLREYISGETIEQLIEKREKMGQKQAIETMLDICRCVQVLHNHVPPLIHRDLKPQNILVTKDEEYKFIDMDTIREYKAENSYDTVFMGTREIAAPEQFGFGQTSVRTDIYSLGLLFLYLLTGTYQMQGSEWERLPVSIRGVIRKCLEFDPKRRYSSVTALSKELKSLKQFHKRIKTMWLQGGIALIVVIVLGLLIRVGVKKYQYNSQSIAFTNPQIEEAVRQSLGIDSRTPICQADLEQVSTLILCGDRTFQSWEEHESYHDTYFAEFTEERREMSPADLSDLQYFTGLSILVLDNQGLEDIQSLEGLTLKRLSLRKNRLTSLSGIEKNTQLLILVAADNPIESIDSLKSLENLNELNIGDTYVTNIEVLEGMPLTWLDVSYTNVTEYDVISTLDYLTTLRISDVNSENIAYVNTLTNLKLLSMWDSKLKSLEELSGLKDLECLDVASCQLDSLSGIEQYPHLDYLGIAYTEITDISVLSAIESLTQLDITATPIEDLSPLKDCKRLECLFIDTGKEGKLRNLNLEDRIQIIRN